MKKKCCESKMVVEIDELCNMLGIGKNTAYSLLTNGDIGAFKIGTVWKIPIASINAYISRKCNESKNDGMEMCKIVK